ncbi:hypothetical protein AGABI2DRAFT_176855 [Agaricus bisporus var. bisporus H97]|uniref:hypothetical protein n=1 Tax=Agaricus bisporus var. bisporus (strain H97 / ATCC MYA-4626 / FGSC 10389) TaxID=936046 RepID=UPI00029F6EF8|nr:hypothetical protein AGABI2DRAFT_176855 [Agaricus bisporus var. bisporus H97]EKV50523.1 hypothetical protein AGABI2DRAFT_176855 [Agaricus bisporus var. bisporus H97]
MTGSHVLPGDIILEIAGFATSTGKSEELCNLRLVSKRFDNLISPLLFSTIRLEFRDADCRRSTAPDHTRCQEIIQALATRSTTVFDHTKKLYFSLGGLHSTNSEDVSAARTSLSDEIFNAICGLKNLRTIHCFFDTRPDTEELAIKIIRALGTLSSFQGFEYIGFSTPFHFTLSAFTFKPLSNLTIFRIGGDWDNPENVIPEVASLLSRCPEMTELSLNGRYSSRLEKPTLRDIFSEIGQLERPWKLQKLELISVIVTLDDIEAYIRHLKHLTFLEIFDNPFSPTFGQIWDIFQQNGIALKELSTDHLEDPLYLHYLSSYSGLTSLKLKPSPERYENPEAVLPKHAETLESLALEWCGTPTKEGIAELVKCQKLTDLQVCVDEMWFDAGLQLSNLAHLLLLPPETHEGDDWLTFNHAVTEILLKYREERGLNFGVNYNWLRKALPGDD